MDCNLYAAEIGGPLDMNKEEKSAFAVPQGTIAK
jgi:hypothetical protein